MKDNFLRRLDSYIIKEITPMFVGGLLVIVLLLVLGALYEIAPKVIAKGANPLLVAQYLAFRLPEAFSRGMPLALLFGVLLSLNRLTQDSELKAAIVQGISPNRLALPVILVGFLVAIFAFGTAELLIPRGNEQSLRVMKNIILDNPKVLVSEGQFFKDGQGQAIYVKRVLSGRQLENIQIIQTQNSQVPKSLTTAPHGEILANEGAIKLFDGTRITYRSTDARAITVTKFKEAVLPIRDLQPGSEIQELPILLSISKLVKRIDEYKKQGFPTYTEDTALQRKFAEPLASVSFALFGVAIALFMLRGNGSLGLVSVMFLTFFYYATWSVFKVMGEYGALSNLLGSWGPVVAAWAPNLIYALAGGILLSFARRR